MVDPCYQCSTDFVTGRRICNCPPGMNGINCDQDIDECTESKEMLELIVRTSSFTHGFLKL